MKDFLLIFRRNAEGSNAHMSPEQLQNMMKPWQDWLGNIAAQNKLVDPGNRLNHDGRVVKPDSIVTNGPYVEIKEAIGGYTLIRATSLDEATDISKSCPILTVGGSVEVREVIAM